ncbi:hypothetical protein CLOM_g4062 [Closterium sp. NIES-68]|nr:hypothetical protein CLOM_g4062 [Closterium sp. NIES-68]
MLTLILVGTQFPLSPWLCSFIYHSQPVITSAHCCNSATPPPGRPAPTLSLSLPSHPSLLDPPMVSPLAVYAP